MSSYVRAKLSFVLKSTIAVASFAIIAFQNCGDALRISIPLDPGGQTEGPENEPQEVPQTQPEEEFDASLVVDASKNQGPMPELFNASVWIQRPGEPISYITNKLFEENAPKIVQINISPTFSGSKDFNGYKSDLKSALPDYLIELLKKNNVRLMIGLATGMPRWLSARAGDDRHYDFDVNKIVENASPPKCLLEKCTEASQVLCYSDYTNECQKRTQADFASQGYVVGWKSVVKATLQHFKSRGFNNLGFFHGHEENKDWFGDEVRFFEAYQYATEAAREVDPAILVGGPGTWGSMAKRLACDPVHFNEVGLTLCGSLPKWSYNGEKCKDPLFAQLSLECLPQIRNFIGFSGQKTEGMIPLDFINYHMFGAVALQEAHDENVATIRSWLTQSGLDPMKTAIYPADWGAWAYDYTADYIDTEYNAAYIIKTLEMMDHSGITMHGHDFDVFNDYKNGMESKTIAERGKTTQFIGDWAIFTRDQVVKPVYNAFRALSLTNGKEDAEAPKKLNVEWKQQTSLSAVASKSSAKVRILISNFVPQGHHLKDQILYLWLNSESMASVKSYTELIKACILNSGPSDSQIKEDCIEQVLTSIEDPETKAHVENVYKAILCTKLPKANVEPCIDEVYQLTTDDQLREDIDGIRSAYEDTRIQQETPKPLTIKIKNLPWSGESLVNSYRIDEDHSNACRFNKKTECQGLTDSDLASCLGISKQTPCGTKGALDLLVAQAHDEARSVALNAAVINSEASGLSHEMINEVIAVIEKIKFKENADLATVGQAADEVCAQVGCLTSERDQLIQAGALFRDAKSELFFNGSYNLQLPDGEVMAMTTTTWIDQINNKKEISLEGSLAEQNASVSPEGKLILKDVILPPNGVLLLEISQVP